MLFDAVEVNRRIEWHIIVHNNLERININYLKVSIPSRNYLDIITLVKPQLRSRELIIHKDHIAEIAVG